jgi:hypothetical protein
MKLRFPLTEIIYSGGVVENKLCDCPFGSELMD